MPGHITKSRAVTNARVATLHGLPIIPAPFRPRLFRNASPRTPRASIRKVPKLRRASVWRCVVASAARLHSTPFRPLRFSLARRQSPTEADDAIVMGTPSSQLSLVNWPNDPVSALSMTTQRVPCLATAAWAILLDVKRDLVLTTSSGALASSPAATVNRANAFSPQAGLTASSRLIPARHNSRLTVRTVSECLSVTNKVGVRFSRASHVTTFAKNNAFVFSGDLHSVMISRH